MSSAKNEQKGIGIPLAGKTVSRCVIDSAFTMEFGEGELLRIEGGFILQSTARRHALSAERAEELGPALVVVGKTISWSSASEGGELDVHFVDGTNLRVSPDSQYEAWEVVGKGGFRVVCMPGGELAIWRGELGLSEPLSS
jgi:hypothetical protein